MSGIFGFYQRGGLRERSALLVRMGQSLVHRGPDQIHTWTGECAALGNCSGEIESGSGGSGLLRGVAGTTNVISADARLDNREELMQVLGVDPSQRGEVPNSILILQAYSKWGFSTPEHLLGDFAFVLWDEERKLLFAARDHFGIKPFYYSLEKEKLLFASEIKAVLCSSRLGQEVDELSIGEFIAGVNTSVSRTFYANIHKLPPGHYLVMSGSELAIKSYWKLERTTELTLRSDADYAEAVVEHLAVAVRSRLQGNWPVGAMLSGGLDSSAIVCLANKSPRGEELATFSHIFPSLPECDERPFIDSVLATGRFQPRYIPGDQAGPLSECSRILQQQDEPYLAPGLFLHWNLNRAARDCGIRVLLDGHGGDETISLGHAFPCELAAQGRFFALWRESRGLATSYGDSTFNLFKHYLHFYPAYRRLSASRSMNLIRGVRPRRRKVKGTQSSSWAAVYNPEFFNRIRLRENLLLWQASLPASASTEQEYHLRTLRLATQSAAFEMLDRSSAAFGIEPRYPFWDRRLVEFCLSLPGSQKLYNGWSRVVIRRGLNGVLPAAVQWRRSKTNLAPNFVRALRLFDSERLKTALYDAPAKASQFLNLAELRNMCEEFMRDPARLHWNQVLMIWRSVLLIYWFGRLKS